MRWIQALTLAAVVGGCGGGRLKGAPGPEGTPEADAGSAPDASAADAGTPSDAGTPVDAGSAVDAGLRVDAGSAADAGLPDAGTPPDAGAIPDAGTVRDAGAAPDAGAPVDAGLVDGGWGNDCPAVSKYVYIVDSAGMLAAFHPDTLQIEDIGPLKCPAPSSETPGSMSVDRQGFAWIRYSDGKVYKADATRPASCVLTGYSPDSSFANFGMGFVADSVGSKNETLYVASGGGLASVLGKINPGTLALTQGPMFQGNIAPELSGTADAKLWAFFPPTDLCNSSSSFTRLSELDTSLTGGTVTEKTSYSLLGIARGGGCGWAWAFAFWGGQAWLFLQGPSDTSTGIWQFDPVSQNLTQPVTDTRRTIVGAGVSICAPTQH